jgi:hydrogenase maturation factor HypF (carbamoyltransferase family)
MTDNKKERTEHETALAAQEFLETIGTAMTKLEIPPKFAITLFGFFARRVVEIEVEAGAEEASITGQVFDAFAEGLGLKAAMVKMEGEVAAQFKAAVERESGDHPLQ